MSCTGDGRYPDNYDGEFTRCGDCGRKLNLDPQGLVPIHKPKEPKGYVPATQRDSFGYPVERQRMRTHAEDS